MTNPQDPVSGLSPLKRALLALDDMKSRLDAAERARTEPIAIVGMSCRLPGGADDADGYWRLLRDGVDAVREVPKARWDADAYYDPQPDTPGKAYGRWGAFLDQVDRFDPQFFGIAPREAAGIDPQQRLLLEVTWEAFEKAGIAADRLAGTPTGVFVGICSIDYAAMQLQTADLAQIDAYSLSGTAHSIAAGRLAYILGLQGPALAVDTACSSSLVAVHLACQSLRNEECRTAVAAGVHVTLSPLNSVVFSRLRMLASDGRCKTFDAKADGFVEGEGCAVIVLKRLSDAIADGDTVVAVIRGSAVNQDGASSGLTAPNGPAQEALIRAALQRAGVKPEEIGYVEAHGTGTSLGDPIEVQALASVLGQGRSKDRPVVIGSVKTNIGHTQAAAGLAGLLKLVLALQHEEIPPSLHLQEPNPFIPWSELPVRVATERMAWPRATQRRVGGVSSFGFSGTNVHVVIEEAPLVPPAPAAVDRPLHLVALSARNPAALQDLGAAWERLLDGTPAAPLADLAFAANAGRAHSLHRAALIAESAGQLRSQIAALRADRPEPGIVRGQISSADNPRIAFLFTGQGAQYVGMGRALYETQPTFRRALDRCAGLLQGELDRPLLSLLYPDAGADSPLDNTGYAQPALFAIEYALAEFWKSCGITPGAVLGHSVGEYAAACSAGVLTVENGIKLIAARGRLMQSLPAGGAMAAVFAAEDRVRSAIEKTRSPIALAALNGPESVVVSGGATDLSALLSALDADGIRSERLAVSHAFHSALMDPILPEFERIAAGISYGAPRVTLISNVTGLPARREVATAAYWRTHLREPVRFADGLSHLYQLGYRIFLEVGPKPTLSGLAMRALPEDAILLPSLRKAGTDWTQVLESLARLYVAGAPIDWAGFDRDYPRRQVSLPTYPFQRERHWFSLPQSAPREDVRRAAAGASSHPLLGSRLRSALSDVQFESVLSTRRPAFLNDHRKRGVAVLPATAYLEMGVAGAQAALGNGSCVFEDLAIVEPLILGEDDEIVQTVISPDANGGAVFKLLKREPAHDGGPERWRLHASGRLRPAVSADDDPGAPLEEVRARCAEAIDAGEYYDRLAADGHDYGPQFRGMKQLWRGSGEALARIELPEAAAADASAYQLHPALIDAAMQLLGAGLPESARSSARGETFLPISLGRFRIHRPGATRAWSAVRIRPSTDIDAFAADVRLYDDAGHVIAEILDVYLRRAAIDAGREDAAAPKLYEVAWREANAAADDAAPSTSTNGSWIVLGAADDLTRGVAQGLEQRGASVVIVTRGPSYQSTAGGIVMDASDRTHAVRMLADAAAIRGPVGGVIHLWGIASGDAPEAAARAGCESLLHVVQAVAAADEQTRASLLVATRGAQAVDGAVSLDAVGQAPLWGLARTVIAEYPEMRCVCIDLDQAADGDDGERVAAEATRASRENQIAFRGGRRYVARLVLAAGASNAVRTDQPVALESAARGTLDRLELRPAVRRAPGPGEIEVRVATAGLNFRDVLNALGMYEGGPIGSECAGTVVAAGDGVTHVQVGDVVLGMVPGGIRSYVTGPAGVFFRKPERLTIEEAATVPVTFLTAEYALHRLAGMKRGDRVLIHAAAGGVGLAAVQLALRAGAEIFATAGSPEKHVFLRNLGVRHVFSSRALDFADQIRTATGGQGVDIVLNSLAGEFIDKSVSILNAGGHFLEIGKAGIWTSDQMAAVRPDLSYHAIYLGDVDTAVFQEMARSLTARFESGELTPLPLKTFPLAQAVDAFRFMAQAKHIGKIVIVVAESGARPAVRPDAAYLVTGGHGALGQAVARRLVARGARHLVLVGRNAPSADAAATIRELEDAGAQIVVAQADVARESDVSRLLDSITAPLAGIVHAAGTVDDGVLAEQTWARFETVLRPKLAGAWHLHRQTEHCPLDFFVMFSSMVSIFGAPGQGNYAAGNAFLDALAHLRHAQGLPALSINWGAWADMGMVAGVAGQDQRRWRQQGFGQIPVEEGLAIFERLLAAGVPQAAVLPIDWTTLLQRYSPGAEPALFTEIASGMKQAGRGAATAAPRRKLLEDLESAPAARRRGLAQSRVREEALRVLGLGADVALDVRQPLRELGLDSLMAVELRNTLAESLGRSLPATLLFKYPTLEELAGFVLSHLPEQAATDPVPAAAPDESDARELEALSDEEARALLSDEVESIAAAWRDGSPV